MTFEPGTEIVLILKGGFLPIPDPQKGVKFVPNLISGVYLGETVGPDNRVETYIVRVTSFEPNLTNAHVRADEVLFIGEISKVDAGRPRLITK